MNAHINENDDFSIEELEEIEAPVNGKEVLAGIALGLLIGAVFT